ncbi:MAG: hypothetical protein QM610_00565 [Chitinophagaceae bacterium]
MRRLLKYILSITLLLLLGWLGYKIYDKLQTQKQAAANIAILPQFRFQTMAHQTFSKQAIKDTMGQVVIMLFSPDCEHCQYMAQAMVRHKEAIKDVQFVMVTPFGDSASVATFAHGYHLDSLSNVQLLLDGKVQFPSLFGSSLVPSFYVYNHNRLVKSIKGETRIENLLH